MSNELTVTLIYSYVPVGAFMTELVRDGWATWNVETNTMLDIPLCTHVTAIRPGLVVRAKVVKDV